MKTGASGTSRFSRYASPRILTHFLSPLRRATARPVGKQQYLGFIAHLFPSGSGPRTVVKNTSVFACSEPLGGPCSCLMKQNTCAKNRSTPLNRLSEPISCDVLACLCLQEQESFLVPHIAPASIAIDAFQSLSLSGRVLCCVSLFTSGDASIPANRSF